MKPYTLPNDTTKGGKSSSIPAKFLKEYHSICSEPIFNIFKSSLIGCVYDQDLKFADIALVYKGEDATSKINDRQISLLPVVSKVYEKIIVRLVYFQLSRKYMRKSYTNRLLVMQRNF